MTKGNYLDNNRTPRIGDVIWALIGFGNKAISGKITRTANIDNKGLSNTYVDIESDKKYHVNIISVFDHKPKRIKKQDEYGEFTAWI